MVTTADVGPFETKLSAYCFGADQIIDPRLRDPNIAQDFSRVFSQQRRRTPDRSILKAFELQRGGELLKCSDRGMIDCLHHSRAGDMRIGEYFGEIINGAGGHAEVTKFLDPEITRLQSQTIIEQALQFG